MIDLARPWAIRSRQNLIALIEKLKAGPAEGMGGPAGPMTSSDGVRIIPLRGVLFRYDNWLTDCGYGMSYDCIYREMQAAANDPTVKEILLVIDSPGGEVNGLTELADYISECPKPISSYVSGICASAAYWIASATGKIYSTRAAYIGSIGVIAVYYDDTKLLESIGIEELVFVSSQSPDKYSDPATEQGAGIIQKHVNETAQIFIDFVAKMRSVSSDNVISEFGKGDVLIAAEAAKVGMIDQVANLQESLRTIYESRTRSTEEDTMLGVADKSLATSEVNDEETEGKEEPKKEKAEGEETPEEEPKKYEEGEEEAAAFIRSKPKAAAYLMRVGAANERVRIKGLEEAAELYPYNKELLAKAKFESGMQAGDFLFEAMKSSKQSAEKKVSAMNADAGEIPAINVTQGAKNKEQELEERALNHAKSMAPGAKK